MTIHKSQIKVSPSLERKATRYLFNFLRIKIFKTFGNFWVGTIFGFLFIQFFVVFVFLGKSKIVSFGPVEPLEVYRKIIQRAKGISINTPPFEEAKGAILELIRARVICAQLDALEERMRGLIINPSLQMEFEERHESGPHDEDMVCKVENTVIVADGVSGYNGNSKNLVLQMKKVFLTLDLSRSLWRTYSSCSGNWSNRVLSKEVLSLS